MPRAAKVDQNQKEIVEVLRKAGAFVLHTHTLKNAFDLMVVYQGATVCVEVKDGDKLPAKFHKMGKADQDSYLLSLLTDGEKKCMEGIKSRKGKYAIVHSVESALSLLQSLCK